MALFNHQQFLAQSQDVAFDQLHHPGQIVPNSGIYRCHTCGREIASNAGTPFPPQNHHQHSPPAAILWRLNVYSQG